ncbi:glycosyltransferase [Flavobacterium tructae]|uniref:glycosyltransferase family 4 protein n=1 Tax=Flavobacterium tructae TaxID=1114873 RepID=UPI002551F2F1|nr:glycosyltransferase [Flavobacterium tructae]MDL2143354.1 glycosyltransferase [Flavobacterium tructae]
MKKKILLIGPFGDFGGRELEVSFIASVLASKYEVYICTTGSVSEKSQVFNFNKDQKVFSVKDILCRTSFSIKLLCFLSYIKNHFRGIFTSYANNEIAKRYFNYDKKLNNILEELVKQYEVVFICADLSSAYMNQIITFSKKHQVKVIFRTTAQIKGIDFNYLNDVDLFIHHSVNNAERIQLNNYKIIDQCTFIQDQLLSLENNNGKTNFLLLGRLSEEKGFEEVIDYFVRCKEQKDQLTIVGDGKLKEKLQLKYAGFPEIKFLGFVKSENLDSILKEIDCLIISSFEESGPLVGIEAMAAAKTIISTKVGAMTERLKNTLNDFWFDIRDYNTFKKEFQRFKNLDNDSLAEINNSLRNEYKKEYTMESIAAKYLKSIDTVLGLKI